MRNKGYIRTAVDIGGTFTDLVAMDESTGTIHVSKADTTPGDFTSGVMETLEKSPVSVPDISFFIHGSTIVINTLTERKGAKTGLVTTRGFRDVLEIGRANRPDLYNMYYRKPDPFVRRRFRTEVDERIGPKGNIITPLDEENVRRIAEFFRTTEIEALAVCFLHSYVNPVHEIRCGELLSSMLPEIPVTISSAITKEWREYERTTTAVLNSYVLKTNREYLENLENRLKTSGFNNECHIMQSNGGIATFRRGKEAPINMVESGPVGGVIGAAVIGRVIGEENIISFDVGGTTAKTSLITGGEPGITTEYRIERTPVFPGYPILSPTIDIIEIGAGGGSIAWIDDSGALKVGPKSAGAVPGPASCGRGGILPTVTDANVLAGRINPSYFLGGDIPLDVGCAEEAFKPICSRFGIQTEEAAMGVIRLADSSMVNALKLVSVRRGYDPRDFVLVACGGGGAMHAGAVVRELQLKKALVPLHPGLFSAFGMLMTDLRQDFVRTEIGRLDSMDEAQLTSRFTCLEEEARTILRDQDMPEEKILFHRYADMRYYGQEHTVKVPVPGGTLNSEGIEEIKEGFHTRHARAYSFTLDAPVEVVNVHLTAYGLVDKPEFGPIERKGLSLNNAYKGKRRVNYDELGFHESRVYERDLIPLEEVIPGPAVLEEKASTTVVFPDQNVTRDVYGFLHIENR